MLKEWIMPGSLRIRLYLYLSTLSSIPLILILLLTYYGIYPLIGHRIENGIQHNLRQVALSLEHSLDNMNYVSQQFVYYGNVGKDFREWIYTENLYEKAQLSEDIQSAFYFIPQTNPTIGLIAYYDRRNDSFLFSNVPVKPSFEWGSSSLLLETNSISYYGPHVSQDRFNNSIVLSAARKVELPDSEDLFIYVETNFNLTEKILETDNRETFGNHLILDRNGIVTYSENERDFPVGSRLAEDPTSTSKARIGDYYAFLQRSNQGWGIVHLVTVDEFNKESIEWLRQMAFTLIVTLLISLLAAILLWRMVYSPLKMINREIRKVETSDFYSVIPTTGLQEFDLLLHHLDRMRVRIRELLGEVREKEKKRADFEVEMLLYQINPHFIHNTLDTIRWLARVKGDNEIDSLASSLNKLLYYNLGKMGNYPRIIEEIEALQDYLTLQKIRYDFDFDVRVHADDDILNIRLPRFILQPLVENSLYHSELGKDGLVRVDIRSENESMLAIRVDDNGKGMNEEKTRQLASGASGETKKIGLGIGTFYVKKILEKEYGDQADFQVSSEPGRGTSIVIRIPKTMEEGAPDERSGS